MDRNGKADDRMEPMDCDRLREVLFDHVDGLLGRAEADAARDHLAACGPCRALQEEVRRNFSALDAWEEEDLPEGALARLEARIAGHASPAPAAAAAPTAPAAPAAGPRRSWFRLAVPYAAGLATAAALAAMFLVPLGTGLPGPAPGGAPSGGPDDVDTPAPRQPFAGGGGNRAVANEVLRPGERPLEFHDPGNGVLRKFLLPPGIDPGKVMLVDTPPRILPDDEGVR